MSAIEGTTFQAVLYPDDLEGAAYMSDMTALQVLVRGRDDRAGEQGSVAR